MSWIRLTERKCKDCGESWFIRPACKAVVTDDFVKITKVEPVKSTIETCPMCRAGMEFERMSGNLVREFARKRFD